MPKTSARPPALLSLLQARRDRPGASLADIEVVGPVELRDAFARLARRYAGAATEAPGPVSGEGSAKL
jgi:hypothetical protein